MSEREIGKQRRRSQSKQLLHCCCICGKLDMWDDNWSWFGSVKDLDDESAFPKFCSAGCKAAGGEDAYNVTKGMKQKAKDAEWRDPEPYREPERPRNYNDAAYE